MEIYAGWLHINICQRTISYRDTALAILSEKDGLKALKIPTPLRLLTRGNKNPTPLHLMVKEMPGETVSHAKDLNSLPCPYASMGTMYVLNSHASLVQLVDRAYLWSLYNKTGAFHFAFFTCMLKISYGCRYGNSLP